MVPKSVQTCFEHVLGRFFEKVFLLSVPWRVELSKIFKKNQKLFKIAKKPKIVPKGLQTCFEHVLGNFFEKFFLPSVPFFEKFFLPSVPWRVESSKIFKKIKNFSKFQKCPKPSPKVSKRVLNMFWGDFSKKIFAHCSMEGRVVENFQKKSKTFQNCKNAQNLSRKCPNVFWTCFG